MKLITDYDLVDKVNSANGIINYKKIMLNEMKTQATFFGVFTGLSAINSGVDGIQWETNFIICSGWFVIKTAVYAFLEHKFKDRIEYAAYLELAKLALQLGSLNINTNVELLKNSTLIETEYKFIRENSKPIIQQNKYILVPAYDGVENIKDAHILQEHEVGSKQYSLSIGSPQKSLKLAHAYS